MVRLPAEWERGRVERRGESGLGLFTTLGLQKNAAGQWRLRIKTRIWLQNSSHIVLLLAVKSDNDVACWKIQKESQLRDPLQYAP